MKFNWGTGITIFIVFFLLVCAFVVYKSFQQKNDLVEEEYYPQGLDYQNQIKRFANVNSLSEKITLTQDSKDLQIKYPIDLKGKHVKGIVTFFRPSDENADVVDSITFDTAMVQHIAFDKMIQGKYIAKFFWKMDDKQYAHEIPIVINK